MQQEQTRIGRYELVASLGAGGMGHVYRARAYAAAGVTKDVCIKRIRPDRLRRPGAVQRFIAEARVSIRLSHANIVPVFDFGRAEDGYYLAMDWVDGVDLMTLVTEERVSELEAAYIGAHVANALAYAHSQSTVHRDVKPANVLVSKSGDVMLADFGVAAAVGAHLDAAGTLAYMAPEQKQGGEITPGADLYSLGRLLASICALDGLQSLVDELTEEDLGRRPSDADSVAERLESFVAARRVDGAQSPRSSLRERVSNASPRERPMMRSLDTDLSFVRDGQDATFSTRMGATQTRRPVAIWWVLAGIAMGVLALAPFVLRADEPVDQPNPRVEQRNELTRTNATSEVEHDTEQEQPTDMTVAEATIPVAEMQTGRPRREMRRVPRRARPAPEVPQTGQLSVNAAPWAFVDVDGTRIGETPILGYTLTVGPHRVVLSNPELDMQAERSITVLADETTRLVVELQTD